MRLISLLSIFSIAEAFGPFSFQTPLTPANDAAPIADIPPLGFGTWNLKSDHENATKAVAAAIVAGYRHIDCAAAYGNEPAVGRGIAAGLRAAKLSRSDIWVTSKLWNTAHGSASQVRSAAERTIGDLGVGYLDLYLMHWPVSQSPSSPANTSYLDTWRHMAELPRALIRRAGVCNFSPAQMRDLLERGGPARPYSHQMETHPYLPQAEWLQWHASQGIWVTAYSPLGNMNPTYDGKKGAPELLLDSEEVREIADGTGCTPAQVVLKWGMARGIAVIPKSKHVARIEENLGATECELRYEDFETLAGLGGEPFRFNNPSESWGVKLFDGLQGV